MRGVLEHWRSILENHSKKKKNDTHPGIGFYEHEQSKKHSDDIRNKTEIKTILSTGNNLFQLQKRAENRTEYERKQH